METEREHFVEVRVITTSGVFPNHGFEREPENQPIRILLARAAKELKIADTTGWIALAAGARLNVERSYKDNALRGRVEIDWGPDHGGGGRA